MSYGLLLLRLVLGLTFAAHGFQKLFGAFGGLGLRGAGDYLGGLGYRAPIVMAGIAGTCEIGGGLLLASGLLTPVAGLTIAVLMVNAIAAELWPNGFFVRFGGIEYALLIWTVAIAVSATGPGRFSLDAAIGWSDEISGLWWGVGAAGLSVVVAGATLTFGRHARPAPEPGVPASSRREA
jgi:putative oxidoreductase